MAVSANRKKHAHATTGVSLRDLPPAAAVTVTGVFNGIVRGSRAEKTSSSSSRLKMILNSFSNNFGTPM
nr:hypothetical protein TetV2_00270 [Oceanusvirus sp.]